MARILSDVWGASRNDVGYADKEVFLAGQVGHFLSLMTAGGQRPIIDERKPQLQRQVANRIMIIVGRNYGFKILGVGINGFCSEYWS